MRSVLLVLTTVHTALLLTPQRLDSFTVAPAILPLLSSRSTLATTRFPSRIV